MSRADEPAWLRTQHTIRKLLESLGKDALVYAQSALTNEASEPERVRVFWENARKCFDEYDARA
jgi:predicted TIM-barrel fold metal-dependent hydrolase